MQVKREELAKVVQLVMPGLATKEVIEQSGSVVFSKGRVFTFNDQIAVSHPFECEIEGAISGKKLLDFLKRSRDDELTIKAKAGVIEFVGKKNRAGIKMSEDVTLPIGEVGKAKDWQELPDNFSDAVRFCMFSTSRDQSKPLLTCVHIDGSVAESCDNYRMTRIEMNGAVDAPILVPADAAKDLIKYKPTHVAKVKGWLHFKNKDNTLFCCRTYDEKYPSLQQIIDVDGDVVKWPKGMPEAIEKASVFTDSAGEVGTRIKVDIEDGKVTVRGQGDHGYFEETMRVRCETDAAFEINPSFFSEILGHTNSAIVGKGRLRFEDEGWYHVVMMIPSNNKPTKTDDDIPF